MNDDMSLDAINEVLLRIKEAVTAKRRSFIGRKKNLSCLAELGLLPCHVWELVLSMTYRNFVEGPQSERNPYFPAGEIYTFGICVDKNEVYVKIKMEHDLRGEVCICLSFHMAERSLCYFFG